MLDVVEVVARETESENITVLHDFREVPVYVLQESPTNPRRSFDEAKLHELAQSIRSQGVLVPLIVRELDLDRFEIVAGARRFRTARLAEIPTVQVRIVNLTDTQVLEYQLIENAIREDVHHYEEAMAYKALLDTSEPHYDVASGHNRACRQPGEGEDVHDATVHVPPSEGGMFAGAYIRKIRQKRQKGSAKLIRDRLVPGGLCHTLV